MAKRQRRDTGPRSSVEADKVLGQRIRLLRVEKKMSQSDLAQTLGVSFQQVQKYEKGVNRVGANRLQQIADALATPVASFYREATKDKGQPEMQSLLFSDSKLALRLLRAYTAIKNPVVQRRFVTLLEVVAGITAEEPA